MPLMLRFAGRHLFQLANLLRPFARYEDIECVVYSGDTDTTGEAIVVRARERFGVSVPRPVRFVWLRRRAWLEAERYPHLTLLGQSFGSLVVAWEALCLLAPDLYVDTTGYAFTLPLFRYVGGCRVACYVHYPTVSTDMLTRVRQRTRAHNNSARIADSAALSALKAHYYGAFAGLYGLAGRCSHGVMVNSTWTRGHIETLWGTDRGCLRTVYPPCGTAEFLELPCDRPAKGLVVSIGQFRPEKDHELQIKSFGKFLDSASRTSGASRAPSDGEHYKLVFIGSCRNSEDSGRVDKLQQLCRQLGIADSVEFRVNAPFHEVKRCLGEATIGLHAMWNEHFGIGIVECMAAGTVVLAHDSGGPKLDIVDTAEHQRTGFLASDVDTYAEAMQSIFSMSSEERLAIVQRARSSVLRFSEEKFEQEFLSAIAGLLVTIL